MRVTPTTTAPVRRAGGQRIKQHLDARALPEARDQTVRNYRAEWASHPMNLTALTRSRPACWTAATAAVAALVSVTAVIPAHAETTQVLALASSVSDLFSNIRNWLMGILAGLATVFLSIGGVRYLMAGDPGEVEKAKSAFKSAGIGYALAALAPLVVTVLKGIVGS